MTGGLYAQQINLEEIITRAAGGVEEALPQGTKVAILNFASPSEMFSDYIIEELTGKLVAEQKITIVDRRNLALISQEMNLQLSGDVSDESAQAIGKMLGAQSIISGTLTNMGTFYRIRIRVINVETAVIQAQVSLDLKNDSQVAFLLNSSPANTPPVESGGTLLNTSANDTAVPLTNGTMVPGNSLTDKLAWLDRSADSHNTYILVMNANETIAPYTFEYKGAINITVALRGDAQNRTIRLSSNGRLFSVKTNVTLILENNITLQGHNGNNGAMVYVGGGTYKMRTGTIITGNASSGVYVDSRGSFEMSGGIISGNSNRGVSVVNSGTFTMTGGTISGNTTTGNGGGVFVGDACTFNHLGYNSPPLGAVKSGVEKV